MTSLPLLPVQVVLLQPHTHKSLQELEMECLKTHSTVLPEIGLALLKFVSSHRGLTYVVSLHI